MSLSLMVALALSLGCSGDGGDGGDGPDRSGDRPDIVDTAVSDSGEHDSEAPDEGDIPDSGGGPTDAELPDTSGQDTDVDVAEDDVPIGIPPVVETIVISGSELLPSMFEAATERAAADPRVVYPSDGTQFPRNVAPADFQWSGDRGSYRLTLVTTRRTYHIFTTDWRWQPTVTQWERIVADAELRDVRLEVSALQSSGEVAVGPTIQIRFSAGSVEGAVYYWAPNQNGIVRLPVGGTAPEPFLTATVFNCVGCHALSPDGSRLAYTRSGGGTPVGSLGVIGTDDARTSFVAEGQFPIYYPSFSPDNVRLAAARDGNVVVLNTDTSAIEATLPKPPETSANFPAWSPLGDTVVFSAGDPGAFDSLGVANAGLARVRGARGTWAEAEWLVEPGGALGAPENLFYPSYSPDGRWVVFNRATTAVSVGSSPPGTELWLVSGERGEPIQLTNAGPTGTTNSWPKWAPSSGDRTMWIAFTSNRPYGRVPAAEAQIWIAAIAPGSAVPGHDPSSSAFWMPGQSLGASNHVAYWATYEKD